MSKIIGITGLAQDPKGNRSILGAGKDSVADILVDSFGYVRVSLADEMKRTARRWYPAFTEEHLWGPSEKRSELVEVAPNVFLTARHVLQQLGTEVGRCIWQDTWIYITLNTTKALLNDPDLDYSPIWGLIKIPRIGGSKGCAGVVIPDMRVPNEYTAILEAGGKNVRVFRPVPEVKTTETQHTSEQGVLFYPDDSFSYVIQNTGSLDDLRDAVAGMLNGWLQ